MTWEDEHESSVDEWWLGSYHNPFKFTAKTFTLKEAKAATNHYLITILGKGETIPL